MLRFDKPPDRQAFQRHVTCPLVPPPETGSPGRWTQMVTDPITCLLLPLPLSPLSCSSLCSVACWLAGCWLQGVANRLTSLLQGPSVDHPSWRGPLSTLLQNEGHLRSPKCHTGRYVPSPLARPVIRAKKPKLSLGKDSLGWS